MRRQAPEQGEARHLCFISVLQRAACSYNPSISRCRAQTALCLHEAACATITCPFLCKLMDQQQFFGSLQATAVHSPWSTWQLVLGSTAHARHAKGVLPAHPFRMDQPDLSKATTSPPHQTSAWLGCTGGEATGQPQVCYGVCDSHNAVAAYARVL